MTSVSDHEHVPDDAKRIGAFVGEWTVEGSLDDGAAEHVIRGRWRFDKVADQWGVRGIMHTEIGGMGGFEEAELIGLDSTEGLIHMFSMNKFAIRDHVGGWEDTDTLVTRYVGAEEGREVTEVITVTFEHRDRMTANVVERIDGVVILTTQLTLDRISTARDR